jgi:hypothetical protein
MLDGPEAGSGQIDDTCLTFSSLPHANFQLPTAN